MTIESSGDSYYEGDRISRTGMSIHDATALCAGMTFENAMPIADSVGARPTRAWKSANSRDFSRARQTNMRVHKAFHQLPTPASAPRSRSDK